MAASAAHAGAPVASIASAANSPVVEPAVSGLNGKIEGIYGAIHESYVRGTAASVSLPVGHQYGLQLDGSYLRAFEADVIGFGGHFFRRDPAKGLFGLAVGAQHSTDFTDVLAGFEGELYLGDITLGAFVGYNNADTHVIPAFIPGLVNQRDYVAVRLYATLYLMDNLSLTAEYQNRFERSFFMAGVEYQTPINGLALFVNGGVGENDYTHIMGGARFYIGGSSTLKDRHRKDDPDNINSVFTGTYGAGAGAGASAGPVPSRPKGGR